VRQYRFHQHRVARSADIVTAYSAEELTAGRRVIRVWSNQNGRWSARSGAIVSRDHATRQGAAEYMSEQLDREVMA
jgi:hypothetical protein